MKNILPMTLGSLALATLVACTSPVATQEAQTHLLGDSRAITTNQTGTNGGFYYSFWTNGGGSVSMTLGSAGNYSLNWSNAGDFTAGKGWSTGSGHTISYNAGGYSNSGGGSLALYGWTTNPLVEYYIAESYNGLTSNATYLGTVTTDGGTYSIYKHQQVNQPSIIGNNQTFWQYISVRQSQRTSGTITIQNHYDAWKNLGLNLGTQNMQIMLTEGWNGSGNSNVTVWEGGTSSGGTGGGTGTGTGTGTAVTLNSWQATTHSSGLNVWTGGVGGWTPGAWIEFDNVNISGHAQLNFNLATTASGSFKVLLDSASGPQIGTLNYASTGSYNTYNNQACALSLNGATGAHKLYIVDGSGAANLGALTLQ
jgi:endo-1,4-beta-xylanase